LFLNQSWNITVGEQLWMVLRPIVFAVLLFMCIFTIQHWILLLFVLSHFFSCFQLSLGRTKSKSVLDKSRELRVAWELAPETRIYITILPRDGTKTTRDFVFTFTPQYLLRCILTIDPIWLLLSFNFVHHRRPTNGACVPTAPICRTGSGASWNTVTQQTFTIIRSRTWRFLSIVGVVHDGATWIGDSFVETGCADWVY